MKGICLGLLFSLFVSSAVAGPYQHGGAIQGIVLAAKHRFDPAVQRYMAEQSLAAMPIKDGALYYIYPAHSSNAQLESFQIQNLERLLDKQSQEQDPKEES